MQDATQSIAVFIEAAAAKQPTPGGGSVSALVGALSASMGEMVLNYSVNKKDLHVHRTELEDALTQLRRARHLLLGLMVEDQVAYTALTDARKQGGGDGFDAALVAAIRIPQAIGATSIAILQIADRLVSKVNRHLLSDLAVCAELAMATARCASYNVVANLSDIKDVDERTRLDRESTELVLRGVELIRQLNPRIWGRGASAS